MIDNLTTAVQGFGCFPFFLMNSLQSLFFGEKGRKHQDKAFDRNMEFRKQMQDLKDDFQREQMDSQLAFRRESYELGRQYLIEQTLLENESRRKQTEFNDFCNNKTYWPLVVDIFTALSCRDDLIKYKSIVPLNVLIAWTDVSAYVKNNSSQTPNGAYYAFCDRVIRELRALPDVTVESAPWLKKSQSSISEIYNINFILQGQPTLLVFPYQIKDGSFGIEMAAWSFNRGPQAMQQDKFMHIPDLSAFEQQEAAIAAVKATIGMARDSYMLSEYRKPFVYNSLVDEKTLQYQGIRTAFITYYKAIENRIKNDQGFRELCTDGEWKKISESLSSTKFLAA